MIKKILAVAMTAVCVLALAGCGAKINGTPQRYDDTKSLSTAVDFKVIQPGYIPEGYALAGYYAVENKIAEILYVSGEEELIFAMTKAKNVASDLGEFDSEQEYEFNGNTFTYSMRGGVVHLIVSNKNDMKYIIYSKNGIEVSQADAICKGMFIADMDTVQTTEPEEKDGIV